MACLGKDSGLQSTMESGHSLRGPCDSSQQASLMGGPGPVCSGHSSPIRVQLTTEDVLKPGFGKQGSVLLPVPNGLNQEQPVEWTWPWTTKAPTSTGQHC